MSDLSPAALPAIPPSCDARRQAIFCDTLASCGNVRVAAAAACISPQTAYRTRHAAPDFARAWDAALVLARAATEQELADRALNGVVEPVFYHGEQVAVKRRFDTRLLLAHLARLDKLAENAQVRSDAARFDEALAQLAAGEPLDSAPPAPAAPICPQCIANEAVPIVERALRWLEELGLEEQGLEEQGLTDPLDSGDAEYPEWADEDEDFADEEDGDAVAEDDSADPEAAAQPQPAANPDCVAAATREAEPEVFPLNPVPGVPSLEFSG